MRILRYTIKAVIDIDAEYPDAIGDLINRIQEDGAVAILDVEVLDKEKPLPSEDDIAKV